MFVDLPLDELRTYVPDVAEPADFDEFWRTQVATARAAGTVSERSEQTSVIRALPPERAQRGSGVTFSPVDSPLAATDVIDVEFPGYGGDPIKGWLLVPRVLTADAPVVVEYVGYNGGRGCRDHAGRPLPRAPASRRHPHRQSTIR